MRFVMTQKPSVGSAITSKGRYGNSKGRITHHARKSETPIDFVGVDGEGVTLSDGSHRYVLLGCGNKQLSNPEGLRYDQCFEFLYSNFKPGTGFVGFFLGYDFTQIFKTLPEDRAHMLLTSEGRALRQHRIPGKAPHPVSVGEWQCDILGMKRLRIRPKDCECTVSTCQCKKRPWMYVCDVGPFFQSSFLTVIDPKNWAEGTQIVTDEEYQLIKQGKEHRADARLDEDMLKYNALENEVLGRVMRTLDAGFHEIGVHLPASKWFGPGQASQVWLKAQGVPGRAEIAEVVPPWYMEAARASYFGGWFEIMMHGIIPGKSYEYDINSAYPSVISELPCLLHGTYTRGEGIPPDSGYTLVYATVYTPESERYIGAMLHRDRHGRILRPRATKGWYWNDELETACRAGIVGSIEYEGWVSYEACSCAPPVAGMVALYQKRLSVGKKTPLGKGAKLVYNAGYGKFAQSIGEPQFANPVYASRITSGCRSLILDAIASHPIGTRAVAMVATDAVYFLTPHPGLPQSEKIGEWDYQERNRLTLFKPGVYWDDRAREQIRNGQSASFKARGFSAMDFSQRISETDTEFERWNTDRTGIRKFPRVDFTCGFSMVSGLQALRRHKWELAGAVNANVPVVQDSDPGDKRVGLYADEFQGRKIFRSSPYDGIVSVETDAGFENVVQASHPYEKRFGMDDPWSEESKAQFGETPDGSVGDLLAWILKGE